VHRYSDWKRGKNYGKRWLHVEILFSTLKRIFGKYSSAIKFSRRIKEMIIKVSLYNMFKHIA
jgi:hypothetical protein